MQNDTFNISLYFLTANSITVLEHAPALQKWYVSVHIMGLHEANAVLHWFECYKWRDTPVKLFAIHKCNKYTLSTYQT
jgi:hypothetical protein